MDNKKRTAIQFAAALIQNANLKGFFTGKIYTGDTKQVCVPGLNCYSCPGAVGACPIGSLQNSLSSFRFRFPYYVVGLLIFFGVLMGRLVCGFLCPFGLLQDLLYKIPFFKKIKTFRFDKKLRALKYIILILFVIVLPVCVKLTPFFCKYICPSGTLSGILLGLSDTALFSQMGKLFSWKLIILSGIVILSLMLFRPFCRYLCPLGAIYGIFNKFSLTQMAVDTQKCSGCMTCSRECDMCVNPLKNPNSTECIRCGKCVNMCPEKAIKFTTVFSEKTKTKKEEMK